MVVVAALGFVVGWWCGGLGLGEVSWFRGLRPWRYGDTEILL